MKFVSQFFILFLLTILTGCQTQSSVSKTPSPPTQEADSLPVIEVTETAIGLYSGTPDTSEPSDITPAPSPFPTSKPPTPKINPVNLEELDSVPNQNEMDGFYVFTYPRNPYFQIELVDARTGDQRSLLPDGYASSSVSISPDRQWLVFSEFPGTPGVNVRPATDISTPLWQDYSLIFISSDGSEFRIPYQAEWGAVSRWLNKTALTIRRSNQPDRDSTLTAGWVLDPFANQLTELPPDPSDIYFMPPFEWSGIGMVSYNSTLTHRVYPNDQGEMVLETLNPQEKILQIQTALDVAPEWSPDGQRFLLLLPVFDGLGYSADGDFWLISTSGEMIQTTDFAGSGWDIYPGYYSWSPDGQKIAFWVQPSSDAQMNDVNLAVLDLATAEVKVLSIESSYNGPPTPIWSPNANQLLVGVSSKDGERTLLVDLTQQWVVQIAKDRIPEGWLVNNP